MKWKVNNGERRQHDTAYLFWRNYDVIAWMITCYHMDGWTDGWMDRFRYQIIGIEQEYWEYSEKKEATTKQQPLTTNNKLSGIGDNNTYCNA